MTDETAPPPPLVPAPPPITVVEPRYIPKSVTFTRENDGAFKVDIKGQSLGAILLIIITVPILIVILPILALIGGGGIALLLFVVAVGFMIFLVVKGLPTMRISSAGVEIGGQLYRIGDTADFRSGADDAWLVQLYEKIGLTPIAVQYGIYAVKTPYLLPKAEAVKVAPFLTMLLKEVNAEIGKERARKIQQAQEF